VQGTIEHALSAVLAREVPITGAGRTDAGVHALQSFVHFDHHHALPKGLLKALNRLLPDDISVARIIQVADGAHTRYDATTRSYAYYLHFAKDPFLAGRSWLYPYGIPDQDILAASCSFVGDGKRTFLPSAEETPT
jgi:tRNA pseudouridine38-40 synthase